MKRVKRIVTALCILFPVFLLLVCSVILVGGTDDNDDGNPKHASGLGLSDKVREYAAFVGDTAAEYNIHEYEKYLLAIMMVETGGEGNDTMQSLGNSGLTEEEKEILTDACKIFVIKGQDVHLVEGEVFNIKITYPYDLRVAETLIKGEDK